MYFGPQAVNKCNVKMIVLQGAAGPKTEKQYTKQIRTQPLASIQVQLHLSKFRLSPPDLMGENYMILFRVILFRMA